MVSKNESSVLQSNAEEVTGFDGTPLVFFSHGAPHPFESYARNETGVVDLRNRPMWDAGWKALLRIRYDADMFNAADVVNLLDRAGGQVGIGEGRPDSPRSNGMGWGLFACAAG